ncbi:hypothetical protein [Hymenobacter koreensis]|uniref:PorT family protein n=1 Tax=Hymenobacter koreensis TaxID=1084523 RepID=A0ABP8IUW7_9BACT
MKHLLLLLVLWTAASPVFAQRRIEMTEALPVPPKWDVKLQLTAQAYRVRYSELGFETVGLASVQVGAGYGLSRRLRLQASASYRRYTTPRQLTQTATQSTWADDRRDLFALPVWARYTLTRQPGHRLQFDLVGGPALLRARYRFHDVEDAIGTQPRIVNVINQNVTEVQFTYGLSARYRLAGQLDLVADAGLNQRLFDGPNPWRPGYFTSNLGLMLYLGSD